MSTQSVSFGTEPITLQIAKAQKPAGQSQIQKNELNKDVVDIAKKEETSLEKETKDAKETKNQDIKPEKKPKKSIFEKWANFVGSMKKAGVNVVEYTKGFFKGIFHFATSTVATVGLIFVGNKIKQGIKAAKESEGAKNAVGETFKRLGEGISKNFTKDGITETLKSGKGKLAIAGGVAVGILAFLNQLYKAKLASNEKNAMIDHKYVKTPVVPSK